MEASLLCLQTSVFPRTSCSDDVSWLNANTLLTSHLNPTSFTFPYFNGRCLFSFLFLSPSLSDSRSSLLFFCSCYTRTLETNFMTPPPLHLALSPRSITLQAPRLDSLAPWIVRFTLVENAA